METRPEKKEKTEAEKAEDQRRASQKESYERAAIEHAKWYKDQILAAKHRSANYQRVGSPEASKTKTRAPALDSSDNFSLLEPGVYECPNRTTINLTRMKDDSMRAEPLRFGLSARKAYGDAMDLLASGCGAQTITIDWDNPKDVNMKDLDMLIALAKERSLAVEFGPNVLQHMMSKNDNGVLYAKYVEKSQELQKTQDDKFKATGHAEKIEKYELTQARNSLSATEKLPGNDDADKTQKLKDKVLKGEGGNELQGAERLKAIEKEVQSDQQRFNKLTAAKSSMERNVKAQESVLTDPNTKPDKLRRVAENASANQADRLDVLQQVKSEHDDLKARTQIWEEELQAEKAKLPAADADRTPEQKQQFEKIESLERMLAHRAEQQKVYDIPAAPPALPDGATQQQIDNHKAAVEAAKEMDKTVAGLETRVKGLPEKAVVAENKLRALEVEQATAAPLAEPAPLHIDADSSRDMEAIKTGINTNTEYGDLSADQKKAMTEVLDQYAKGEVNEPDAVAAVKALAAAGTTDTQRAQLQKIEKVVTDFVEKTGQQEPEQTKSLGMGSGPK